MFKRSWIVSSLWHQTSSSSGSGRSFRRARRARSHSASGSNRPRLTLEWLEDRLSPATLTVNSTADTANPSDPYLSVREAIAIFDSPTLPTDLSPEILGQISGTLHANGSDTIVFDPAAVTGSIGLNGGQLELSLPGQTAQVTIDGAGRVTLDGGNATRLVQVDPGTTAELRGLALVNGNAPVGAGLYNQGTLTVADCVLYGNTGYAGGAVLNQGELTVRGCTLGFNVATLGAAIDNEGMLTADNSTLLYNAALASGGAILNQPSGTALLTSLTISLNSASGGGGLDVAGGLVLLRNCIVAGNQNADGSAASDIGGAVDPGSSYNLIGTSDGLTGISDGVNHNRIGTAASPLDPRLGPLGDQGGPTQTTALLAGSIALDTGEPALAGTPDQRGVVRTGGVNIGAYQASATAIFVTAPATVTAGVPFDVTVSAIDPYSQPAAGYTGTVHFSSADPYGATLPNDYPFTLADGGSHTFTGRTALYTAGTWDVTAINVANGLRGSANVNVVAGSAVAFQVLAPASAVAGTPFDVTVVAVDAFGNVATNYSGPIHFSSTDPDPNVVLPPDYTFQPGDGGMVTFSAGVTLFTPGLQILTVTDVGSGIHGSTIITL
jgi:hypothetical protein